MPMFAEKEFIRLRELLAIEKRDISEELVRFPQILMEVHEHAVKAGIRHDEAHQSHKMELAIAAGRMRLELINGKKRPETEIASEAPLQENAISAALAASDARADLSYWQALADSMKAKQSSLKYMTELITSGFLSSSAGYASGQRGGAAADYAQSRAELSAARAASPVRRRSEEAV